jgi:hypothetical protein
MLTHFWRDEAGFIISAELVLVATILVIGLIVGMSELQHSIVGELNDVGEAIGKLNQSYAFTGFSARKGGGGGGFGIKSFTNGSFFIDHAENCDCNQCDLDCDRPQPERPKRGGGFGF